jgi:hypothetical protein
VPEALSEARTTLEPDPVPVVELISSAMQHLLGAPGLTRLQACRSFETLLGASQETGQETGMPEGGHGLRSLVGAQHVEPLAVGAFRRNAQVHEDLGTIASVRQNFRELSPSCSE